MKKRLLSPAKLTALILVSVFVSQPVMAGKIKCWRNNEGTRECGAYVPPEYSQKRTETRNESGRVIEVEERAKTKAEITEITRLKKLIKIEEAKRAEQKKNDDILLKTFSTERDIKMLRDSKINVIEGILTVTNGNNKALRKKLEKLQKRAANAERRGKKPPQNLVSDIKAIEARLNKSMSSIKAKRVEQQAICKKFAYDLQHFRELKNKKTSANSSRPAKASKPTKTSMICDGTDDGSRKEKAAEGSKPVKAAKK